MGKVDGLCNWREAIARILAFMRVLYLHVCIIMSTYLLLPSFSHSVPEIC
jgi:hypothetical protein